MAKFLDASGVKHFWGKITDWVNGLGISHGDIDKLTYSSPTNPDNVFDFPRISLERCSNDRTEWGLKIKNGYKYAQAGYVPILFCKMRHRDRGWWVHDDSGSRIQTDKTTYQSEFMRHPRVFLTTGKDDKLGMFWGLSRNDVNNFSFNRFLDCGNFFSEFQKDRLFTYTYFPNILCKTEYNTTTGLPVHVHTYKHSPLQRGSKFEYHPGQIRSWKFEKRNFLTNVEDDVPIWTLRKLEFEFKIGFCPNYFSYRNPHTYEYIKYNPANQFQSDYFYYYSDYLQDVQFYDKHIDTTKDFPIVINHRYKLSDCVSNVVTFKCVSSVGDSILNERGFRLIVC